MQQPDSKKAAFWAAFLHQLVPEPRIELGFAGYESAVLPLNYSGIDHTTITNQLLYQLSYISEYEHSNKTSDLSTRVALIF